ncbi:MAG: bifunctional 2-polyprenyl-6-hydroxyphenol methylase/3-demethylubiquinol 3-O-methyltransferase UbiG [Pseudomonadales bacterium]|nr:bifunctional 2-polyprenyl-6-hydroxyphenol methylase/3-demethylubiquinol 3-O-methyltransferase UbiG [Pseudomonadales bacterium]
MHQTSNSDQAEIRKFEALASRWWDPASEFRPLHEINPLRMGFISSKINPAGLRVADIGCGGGLLSEAMAQHGARVTGIDLAEASLAVARLHQLESGLDIDYRHQSAENLAAEASGQYDIVCCLEMLEHVPDPAAIVTACASLLKPGGHLFCSTINRNPKSYLFAVIGAEYILGLLPRGTHDYARFVKPSELASWARQAGLKQGELIGLGYNPFTRNYALQADISVNYLAHFSKPADAVPASTEPLRGAQECA